MFKVEFHRKAVKELKKLDAQIIRIIKQDIDKKLKIDPIGYGEPLRGKLMKVLYVSCPSENAHEKKYIKKQNSEKPKKNPTCDSSWACL